jgi:hypothetical protein
MIRLRWDQAPFKRMNRRLLPRNGRLGSKCEPQEQVAWLTHEKGRQVGVPGGL